MTIVQGLLSRPFGRSASGRVVSPAAGPEPVPAELQARAGLSCAPWEGLYLENAEAEPAPVPNPELERFLYSLMSGE